MELEERNKTRKINKILAVRKKEKEKLYKKRKL